MTRHAPEWDVRSEEVQRDQVAAYDRMLAGCPVAHDEHLGLSVFGNEEVRRVAEDPGAFGNHVSDRHIAVPNGMDAPEHTAFRAVNDRYFTADRMEAFEPTARATTAQLVAGIPRGETTDLAPGFARDFALHVTADFMGWGPDTRDALGQWVEKNRRATLAGDRDEIGRVALEFDGRIRALLEERRGEAGEDEQGRPRDVTAELMREVVELPADLGGPRSMTDEEIVSLIRNWTVGELSTIQACTGVVADFLARHPQEQERLREHPGAVPEAVEEIMRLHDPLVSNRRRARKDAEIAGCPVPAGSRVSLNWTAANRDERAFPEATAYRPGRDQSNNLVYGIGVHACPGAPLARLELRLLAEELLAGTRAIRPAGTSVPDVYPVAGFSSVPVVVE